MSASTIIFAVIFFFCVWRHYREPNCPMFYGKLRPYSIAMWASFILFIISARGCL
jgi:hypothetical protein